MNKIIVIGGGIIGLCSSYYLRQEGYDVTVLERGDFLDSCSYGNAGFICPSHFIPLASPGKVKQGFKWMFNPLSPFYIHVSPNPDLIRWGLKFMGHATHAHAERTAIPIRDVAVFSKDLYLALNELPEFDFEMDNSGLLHIFNKDAGRQEAEQIVQKGKELGLEMELIDKKQLQALEPANPIDALGAIHYRCDSHLYPNKMMKNLLENLPKMGVDLQPHQDVREFVFEGKELKAVRTDKSTFEADQFVLATGSWSRDLAKKLHLKIPMMPGRGYSFNVHNGKFQLKHPVLLFESSVAMTPLNANTMRFGGTMEVVPIGTAPRYRRIEGIVNGVNEYFPQADLKIPQKENIWFGYRPCSADGLPYIGRINNYSNMIIATGHSMWGMSLGPGTGKLVAEIAQEKTPSVDIAAFDPERFN